ncbi:hypothetical protein ACHAPJ_012016 [Fusarium lateritium]
MDLIYSKALFTIVAACGNDSDSGLAGLPGHPRDLFQRQVNVSTGGLYLTPCAALSDDDTLGCSAWSQRGWTFQERLLSRCALIFTASQVYWACEDATWDEESLLDLPGNTASAARSGFGCNGPWESEYDKFSRWSLRDYILHFNMRDFTFPADALRAFTGIIRRYEHLNKEKLHWGLRTIRFDQDLTWAYGSRRRKEKHSFVPEGSTVRSVPYPSWSWLGWTGFILSIGWNRNLDQRTEEGGSKSVLAFYSLLSHGGVSLIDDNVESSPPSFLESLTSKWKGEITISGSVVVPDASMISELRSLEISDKEKTSQRYTVPYDTGRLVFWTSHTEVPIWLSGRKELRIQTQDGFLKIPATFSGNASRKFRRLPEEEDWDSEVEEDGDVDSPREKVNLIVISRWFKTARSEDTGKLNIMMVEEKAPGSGVWSRLGLAVIDEKDWVQFDIDWRLVILE